MGRGLIGLAFVVLCFFCLVEGHALWKWPPPRTSSSDELKEVILFFPFFLILFLFLSPHLLPNSTLVELGNTMTIVMLFQ